MRALQLLQDYEKLCAPLVQFCPEWFNPDEDQAVYKLRDQRQALENDMREHQLTYEHEVAKFNKDNREEEVLHDEVLPHRYPYSIARLAIVAILATLVVARLFYNYVSKVWVPGFI